jgi:hypothetical protein
MNLEIVWIMSHKKYILLTHPTQVLYKLTELKTGFISSHQSRRRVNVKTRSLQLSFLPLSPFKPLELLNRRRNSSAVLLDFICFTDLCTYRTFYIAKSICQILYITNIIAVWTLYHNRYVKKHLLYLGFCMHYSYAFLSKQYGKTIRRDTLQSRVQQEIIHQYVKKKHTHSLNVNNIVVARCVTKSPAS